MGDACRHGHWFQPAGLPGGGSSSSPVTYSVLVSLGVAGADSELTYFWGHRGDSRRNGGELPF